MSALVPLEIPGGWTPPDGWMVRRVDVDYSWHGIDTIRLGVGLIHNTGKEVVIEFVQDQMDWTWLDNYLAVMAEMPPAVRATDGCKGW